ncbi:uncharacterized protein LOC143252303 [Tachypleus tridentatus]|uniref:uncharacterized protein LOC143252303 n=1 Tax=Tachypleus tridentatus TaxID=6853 RepID=UPI003FD1B9B3
MDDTPRRRTRAKLLKSKKQVQKEEEQKSKLIETSKGPEVVVPPEENDAVEVEIELPLEEVLDSVEESIQEEVVRIETGSLNISPSRSRRNGSFQSHAALSPARDSSDGSPVSAHTCSKVPYKHESNEKDEETAHVDNSNKEQAVGEDVKEYQKVVSTAQGSDKLFIPSCAQDKDWSSDPQIKHAEENDDFKECKKIVAHIECELTGKPKEDGESIHSLQKGKEEHETDVQLEQSKDDSEVTSDVNIESVVHIESQEPVVLDEVQDEIAVNVQNGISIENVQEEVAREEVESELILEEGQNEVLVEEVSGEIIVEVQGERNLDDVQEVTFVESIEGDTFSENQVHTDQIGGGEECFVANVVTYFGDEEGLGGALDVVEDIGATAVIGEVIEEDDVSVMLTEQCVSSEMPKESLESSEKHSGVWENIERLAEVACLEYCENTNSKEQVVDKENVIPGEVGNPNQVSKISEGGSKVDQLNGEKDQDKNELTNSVPLGSTSPIEKSLTASEDKLESNTASTNSINIISKSLDQSLPLGSDDLKKTVIEETELDKHETDNKENKNDTEISELSVKEIQIDSVTETNESSTVPVEEEPENVQETSVTDDGSVGRLLRKKTRRSFAEIVKNPVVVDQSSKKGISAQGDHRTPPEEARSSKTRSGRPSKDSGNETPIQKPTKGVDKTGERTFSTDVETTKIVGKIGSRTPSDEMETTKRVSRTGSRTPSADTETTKGVGKSELRTPSTDTETAKGVGKMSSRTLSTDTETAKGVGKMSSRTLSTDTETAKGVGKMSSRTLSTDTETAKGVGKTGLRTPSSDTETSKGVRRTGLRTSSTDTETTKRAGRMSSRTSSADIDKSKRGGKTGLRTPSVDVETAKRVGKIGSRTPSADVKTAKRVGKIGSRTTPTDVETTKRVVKTGARTTPTDVETTKRVGKTGARTTPTDVETTKRVGKTGARTTPTDVEPTKRVGKTGSRTPSTDVETTKQLKSSEEIKQQQTPERLSDNEASQTQFESASRGRHGKMLSKTSDTDGAKRNPSASPVESEREVLSSLETTKEEDKIDVLKIKNENESYKKPFQHGWKREIVFRATVERNQSRKRNLADIYYFTPNGQKLRSMKELEFFMEKNPNHCLPVEYFTFGKYSVYQEPYEVQRQALPKSRTPEVQSPVHPPVESPPVPKRKRGRPPKNPKVTTVTTETETEKESSDDTSTPKGKKRQGPGIKYTAKRFKQDISSPQSQQPAQRTLKNQAVTTKTSYSKKSKQAEAKKTGSQKTFPLLSKIKTDMAEPILCSLHCVGRNGQLPSLHCGVCLCLFHPECVGLVATSLPSIFICQRCRENIKEGKARLPPPGARPVVPQESSTLALDQLEQKKLESKSLKKEKVEEETSPTSTESSSHTNIKTMQESCDEDTKVDIKSPETTVPLRKYLPPPPPLTPAPSYNLGLRARRIFQEFPLRNFSSQPQDSLPSNCYIGYQTGAVPDNFPVSTLVGTGVPVVQNTLFIQAVSKTSQAGTTSVLSLQAPVLYSTSNSSSAVTCSLITCSASASSSAPQILHSVAPQPFLGEGTEPNTSVVSSPLASGTYTKVLLQTSESSATIPLSKNGAILSSLSSSENEITQLMSSEILPTSEASSFQRASTLAVCSTGVTTSSTVLVTSAISTLLPQMPTLRSSSSSIIPSGSYISVAEEIVQNSKRIRVRRVTLPSSDYTENSSSKVTDKTGSPLTETENDVECESPSVEKVPLVTTHSVGTQSDTPLPSSKEEPVVRETETCGVQTEIKLKDIEFPESSDCQENDSSDEDNVNEKHPCNKKVFVKLREHAYSCGFKSRELKTVPEDQKLHPFSCYVSRLIGGFECVNLIFQYLDVADLLSVSQVSRTWRTLATQPFLWKRVCLQGLTLTDWVLCANALERFNTVSLDLRNIKHLEDHTTFWSHFISVLGHLRNLQNLSFGEVIPDVLPAVADTLTQLRSLNVECVTEVTGQSTWTTLCKVDISRIGRLSYLNSLWIRGGGGLRLPSVISSGGLQSLENLTMLRHLHLTTLVGVPSEYFKFIEKLPLLESLAVGNCYSWTRDTYTFLGKLKQLKKLRLERGGQLYDSSLKNALKSLTQLEDLQLLCFVIPTSLGAGLQKLKRLNRLVMWPDTYKHAPVVNQNTLKAVSSLTKLQRFSWGVMTSSSELSEMSNGETDEEKLHNKEEIKMISLLRHKENCKCSQAEEGSSNIGPECTVMVHPNELEQRLSKLFPKTKIEVFRVPIESFNKFCGAFR